MIRWGTLVFLMVLLLSGCVVRTYSVQKERSDLDLSSGNRGFLAGKSNEPPTVAKTTRENKVVEIEMFPLIKSLKKDNAKPAVKKEPKKEELKAPGQPITSEVKPQAPATAVVTAQEYTVQNGDTLQKISSKFYGTMHKWNKIYEANKDRLKAPDKIKPGQILIIPADVKAQPAEAPKSAESKTPAENLK